MSLSFDSEADSKIFFLGALAGLAKVGAKGALRGGMRGARGAPRRAPTAGRQAVKQVVKQASQVDVGGQKKEEK